MAIQPVLKFLQAARNLAKQGIKKEQVMEFAKREFGEVSDLLKRQIEQIFTPKSGGITSIKKPEGEVIEASFKPGMDKRGKVVEESPSQASGITYSIPEKGIFNQKTSIDEITEMLTKNPRRPGGPLDPVEGMTRTAARVVLGNKKIPIPEKADPIDVFEENFGGDALMDLRQAGEELLEKESTGRITESMGEFLESRGLFDLKVDKTARKGMTDEEFRKFLMDNGVDPDDTGFASGGRVQYAFGSGMKLAGFLAIRGKTLKDEIRKAIQNLNVSGDRKLDADVAIDDMLEELGVDRDQFDQKDILNAYDEAYNMLTKEIQMTRELAPKMMERMELKAKYPGIDDEMLDQIIEMDPDKKAQMFADMEMGAKLIEQGRGVDEVKDIIEKGVKTRKDNAGGGFNRTNFAVGTGIKGLGALSNALKKIMNKFGTKSITTADKIKQPPKKTEVLSREFEKRNPNLNRQLTDQEYDDFVEELGGEDMLEGYNFDGTIGNAQKILKQQKDYEASMFQEYKAGRLDPPAGSKKRGRLEFLRKKMEEMEMSGDNKLMTFDEIEELQALEQRYDYLDLVEKAEDPTKKMTKEEIQKLKQYNDMNYQGVLDSLDDDNVLRYIEGADSKRTKQAEGGLSYLMGM